jgi:hypothetical protein
LRRASTRPTRELCVGAHALEYAGPGNLLGYRHSRGRLFGRGGRRNLLRYGGRFFRRGDRLQRLGRRSFKLRLFDLLEGLGLLDGDLGLCSCGLFRGLSFFAWRSGLFFDLLFGRHFRFGGWFAPRQAEKDEDEKNHQQDRQQIDQSEGPKGLIGFRHTELGQDLGDLLEGEMEHLHEALHIFVHSLHISLHVFVH